MAEAHTYTIRYEDGTEARTQAMAMRIDDHGNVTLLGDVGEPILHLSHSSIRSVSETGQPEASEATPGFLTREARCICFTPLSGQNPDCPVCDPMRAEGQPNQNRRKQIADRIRNVANFIEGETSHLATGESPGSALAYLARLHEEPEDEEIMGEVVF